MKILKRDEVMLAKMWNEFNKWNWPKNVKGKPEMFDDLIGFYCNGDGKKLKMTSKQDLVVSGMRVIESIISLSKIKKILNKKNIL